MRDFMQLGRDHQVFVRFFQIADGHVAEELRRVAADVLVGGDEGKVGILRGGLFVVVAGGDLGDVAGVAVLQAGDEAHLGVHLEALKAVYDAAARRFQPLGPVDVVLLVKARAQFDQRQNLLAVFGGGAKVVDQLGLFGQAVNGDLDGGHAGIVGGAADEAQKRLHAFVGVGEQHVLPARKVETLLRTSWGWKGR